MPWSMVSEGLKFQKYTNFPQISMAEQFIDIFCCVLDPIGDSWEQKYNYHLSISSWKNQPLCSRNLPSFFGQKPRSMVVREIASQEMRAPTWEGKGVHLCLTRSGKCVFFISAPRSKKIPFFFFSSVSTAARITLAWRFAACWNIFYPNCWLHKTPTHPI